MSYNRSVGVECLENSNEWDAWSAEDTVVENCNISGRCRLEQTVRRASNTVGELPKIKHHVLIFTGYGKMASKKNVRGARHGRTYYFFS